MSRKERLYNITQERIKKLAEQVIYDRKRIKEYVGYGGVQLSPQEQMQRYLEKDVNAHVQMLQMFQSQHPTWGPTDIAREYLAYDQHFWAKVKEGSGGNPPLGVSEGGQND